MGTSGPWSTAPTHSGRRPVVGSRPRLCWVLGPTLDPGPAGGTVPLAGGGAAPADVDAGFRPGISGGRVQRLADDGRSGGGAPQERRARVVGEADERRGGGVLAGHTRGVRGWGRDCPHPPTFRHSTSIAGGR